MINKTLYEMLPGVYAAGAVVTLMMNDSGLRFFPAALLLLTSAMVVYMRYEFRHLPAKERAQRMAAKLKESH